MAKGGDGVSDDAIYQGLQTQITGLGSEIGQLRDRLPTKDEWNRLAGDVRSTKIILNGNGANGLVRRVGVLEGKKSERAETQALAAVESEKWKTIKYLIDKAGKIAMILILLKMGYSELVYPMFGVKAVPTPIPVATEKR